MIVYCLDHSQGSFRNGYEYAFRADTRDYSYLYAVPRLGRIITSIFIPIAGTALTGT